MTVNKTSLRAGIKVKLGGVVDDDLDNDVLTVTVDSNLHLPAMLVVELYDEDLKWVDDADIDLGKTVAVTFEEQEDPDNSSGPATKVLFQGEITAIEPRFTKNGLATLLIRAYDKSHRLHRGKHSRTFLDVTDSDVVTKIAREAGLSPEVDTTSIKFEYLIQTNQTSMEFLQERAQRIGYWAFATKEKLYFKKPDFTLGSGPTLEWPVELREFRPRLSGVGQPSTSKAEGWDFKNMTEFEGEATKATKFNTGGIKKGAGAAAEAAFSGGDANIAVIHRPIVAQGEAKGLAQSALDEAASEYLQADGECFGDAELMAGMIVTINGVGKRFEGDYLVTSATHLYRNGEYFTRFSMTGRSPNTFRSLVAGNGHGGGDRPQAELSGVVVGVVTNADDKDNLGRVKVKFPWLPKNKGVSIESSWARVSAPMAGTDRGFMFTPAVNDEVLVAFEHGDPNTPYVIGGLWNSTNKPPLTKEQATKEGKTQQHMIKTQAGHVLIFDDKNGEEQIIIRDKSTKNEIIINTKDNTILINADKDIKLEGKNFKVKAVADTVIEAVNAKIKASANIEFKGTKIDAEGTAGVTLGAAGVGKIEVTSAKTSINSGGLDVM